jgi:peptidoglycan/xylan/chitin deacetylase (PgdA/CDA1 family)
VFSATGAGSFGSARDGTRRSAIVRLAVAVVAGLLAYACFAPGPAAAGQSQGIPVLVYHRFDPTKAAAMTVTTTAFTAQLAWLTQHHYRVIPLRAALAELNGTTPGPSSPAVVITADDGHKSVYTELFPLIRKYALPVTLFIYPSAISNASYALTWEQLREMQASGLVDVQSHTYWHPNFRTERRRRTPADYQAFVDFQLRRSRQVLQTRLGKPVDLLAWPFGIVDPELEAAAKQAGYTAAFAYVGGPAEPGADVLALPRVPVVDSDRGDRFGALLNPVGRNRARR